MTCEKIRTELSFSDVRMMFWGQPFTRRARVLGRWHQIKKQLWAEHRAECEAQAGDAWETPDVDECELTFEFGE